VQQLYKPPPSHDIRSPASHTSCSGSRRPLGLPGIVPLAMRWREYPPTAVTAGVRSSSELVRAARAPLTRALAASMFLFPRSASPTSRVSVVSPNADQKAAGFLLCAGAALDAPNTSAAAHTWILDLYIMRPPRAPGPRVE